MNCWRKYIVRERYLWWNSIDNFCLPPYLSRTHLEAIFGGQKTTFVWMIALSMTSVLLATANQSLPRYHLWEYLKTIRTSVQFSIRA